MGDIGMIINYSLLFGAILVVGAMSGYLSERAGIVNIGIDGMMCMGAIFFSIYSSPLLGISSLGPASIIIPLILTMLSTTIMGALHAFACINLKANQVISGTAINLIGAALAAFLNAPLGSILYNGTRLESGYADFAYVGDSIYGSSIIIFGIAILLLVIVYCLMRFTKFGLRYCAIGENPNAVDAQGINVIKYQWFAVLLSSMFAGLAGAFFMFNVKQFGGSVQGLGFLALAIMVAGAWKLEWIFLVSIAFAMFTALSNTNVLTNLGVPREIAFSIPYIVTVVVLIGFSKRVHPPKHSGIPFDKTKR